MVQEALRWLITTSFPKTGQNHPTITSAEQGLNVLSRFAADFEHPFPHEGYHRILYVKPEDTRLNYTRPDIAAILQRVRDSPPIDSLISRTTARGRVASNPVHRGNSNRGYRGWRGRGSLNPGSQSAVHGRSSASRGRRPVAWGGGSGHRSSISENRGTSLEIGGRGSGSRQDPFVVD